jgi:hypothetical protein
MLPTFHDGYLTGLAVSDRAATFSITRSDGVPWRIDLSGVQRLKADDFREGNIISHVEAVTGEEPSRGLLEMLVMGPHQNAAQEYHDKHHALIDALVQRVMAGSLSLLSITPSYGCEVIALCETVSASEVR